MSNCWKCQRELPAGQIECELFCLSPSNASDEQMDEAVADFERNFMEVDWSKVTTLQEVIEILKFSDPVYIEKKSPEYLRLKKFLKPIRDTEAAS